MAFVMRDRVRATSVSTGTGPMAGMSTVAGYQSFAFVGGADTVPYAIVCADTNEWEVGLGTYAGTTLTRVAVLSSSNANLTVNFGAGTKDIFCTLPSVLAMTTEGGIFNGQIQVPAGGSGAQVPRVQDVGNLAVSQRSDIYIKSNVLGTVSQAAGVPTGALMQPTYGFTGGGQSTQITRFADGTMIVRTQKVSNTAINVAQGALYTSAPQSLTFDVSFVGIPAVATEAADSSGAPCWAGTSTASTTGIAAVYMYSVVNTATARLTAIAVGRWF